MPTEPLLSLVIPTYNERGNLARLLEELRHLLEAAASGGYELIVVDDDSPARTWELADEISREFPQVRVLRREGERGLSAAVVAGWKIARGKIWGVIDADLQHPPAVIVPLLAAMTDQVDLAVATRPLPGGGVSDWKWSRRILSRGAQAVAVALMPPARQE